MRSPTGAERAMTVASVVMPMATDSAADAPSGTTRAAHMAAATEAGARMRMAVSETVLGTSAAMQPDRPEGPQPDGGDELHRAAAGVEGVAERGPRHEGEDEPGDRCRPPAEVLSRGGHRG